MRRKLITQSKFMLYILKILLLLIPIIIIFCWIFPITPLSTTLCLGQSIGNKIGEDYYLRISEFIWNNKLLGLLGSLASALPLLIGLYLLIKLFKNYSKEEIFTLYNAKIYSKLGYLCILSSLIFNPLSQLLFSLAISINYPVGHRFISIGANSTNITAIICGALLIIVSKVMQIGHKINEEQDLTI